MLLEIKGPPPASHDLTNAFLKTLDLAYNPKYGKLNPAFKDAALRSAEDQSQPPDSNGNSPAPGNR